ncbi:MAG: radical SAM family heme chaperone HemW [Corallococcus sp.]|nr:radical SAM family heme chaperone HemW [Bacillota bacterium]MCM1534200.1 radical SAM family heme chaperone HemW [Corallococcus sp.]
MYNYGIYVHIPFCKARCGYCAFSSCCDYSLQQAYFRKLFEEIEARSDKSVAVSTVYLGGGTPSSVDIEYLDRLFACLADSFDLSAVSEITVECNPESVNGKLLDCLKRNCVNRLSFGLQSVNDATLKRIGRLHRYGDFLKAAEEARKKGFDNINADLIAGLPETFEDFKRSVDCVASSNLLTHVSVYALELHEDSPIYNMCLTEYAFSDDETADMYDYAANVLSQRGFARYEISNFAKAGRECRHNVNYWDEGRYYAFGAAASGFVGDVRYANPFSVEDYIFAPLSKILNAGDTVSLSEQANEYVMLRLRLSSGVDLREFRNRYGNDFFAFFPCARSLADRGFLTVNDGFARVPDSKLYVVNSILCELLTL